ncbi:radical SAM family heme chaperone HemW [Tessaracoccus flavus]|uniref:Heme chaperone HemW n=1 Tax=Tessaracoccus flavus TaxID=1610493 RepID=A0A1Q2CDP0_9ACTN|nr:radical SAM family heme chaperone HemW [Tessaracoccus flavus]AQP44229.1 coproporphyrinogen III oxidase [Tessaracoccus flavus]SDY38972.1 coproporphyrinogen III oxidase, anaerobic [Tessaracoccus flavus]
MPQLPDGDPAPRDGSLPAHALDASRPLSLYIHVPFCRTRCGYCDFNTYTPSEVGELAPDTYLGAALAELDLAARVLGPRRVDTVFFGGGTPTMLPADQLVGLLSAARDRFDVAPDAEITTEGNPETLTPRYLATLRAGGFTRLSLGLQSVVGHVLKVLERTHTPRRGLDAARWASQEGFDHISLDLIYGTPGESMDDWRDSLDAVTATPVDHVSAYSLIVEEGTRLAVQVKRGLIAMPDDDDLADKYLVADEKLSSLGYANYEVSNWARPGGRCLHNLAYWRGADWWGIGPGAHSHIGGVRFWNRKHPRSYAAALAEGGSPALAREVLSDDDRRIERVLLELRLAEGVALDVLTDTERSRLPDLERRGLATTSGTSLTLTQAGRLLADGVIRDLLD